MSVRLAISAALSVLLMAAFVLSSTPRASQPFGDTAGSALAGTAQVQASSGWLGSLIPALRR